MKVAILLVIFMIFSTAHAALPLFCPNCVHAIPETALTCPGCGAPAEPARTAIRTALSSIPTEPSLPHDPAGSSRPPASVRLRPVNVREHTLLSRADEALKSGDTTGAANFAKALLRLLPEWGEPRRVLAECALRERAFDLAREEVAAFLARMPGDLRGIDLARRIEAAAARRARVR